MGESSLNKAVFGIIISVIPTPGMHTISTIKEFGVGNFGLNRSGLNTHFFSRQLKNTKKGQKREIEEYRTFELVIAFLYLVAAKGAI